MSRHVTVRLGGHPARVAARLDLRVLLVVAAGTLATLTAVVVGVGSGDFEIAPMDVVATLIGQGSFENEFVVIDLRLPRVLVAILAGAAFALSGAIFQTLARNPLVAPDVIGINSGAALVAVGVIVLGFPLDLLTPGAFLGALAAAVLLYVLSFRAGLSTYRLVLVGIALDAAMLAGVNYLLTRGDIYEVQRATLWLIGTVYASDWSDVRLLAITILALAPASLVLGRQLDALQLGDDLARGLGAHVERTRLVLILVAVGLASAAVSVAGPIGFVAFIAPQIARRLADTSGVGALPASLVIGGLLVLVSDLVAQRVFAPTVLPVGIVTTVLGAPYFLYLLQRAQRQGQIV